MKVSSFSTILVFVFFSLVGLMLVSDLPIKLSPSQNLPVVNVSFSMYGSSPIVVETEATSKLEAMLSRVAGLHKINSYSGNGVGTISIQLDKTVDPSAARFEISTIVRQAWPELPSNVSYPSVQLRGSDENAKKVFLSYILVAPTAPLSIQRFAEDKIKNNLASIPGVYQINVNGALPMEWQLEFDYKQLEILGLSISDLRNAIQIYLKNESLGVALVDRNEGVQKYMRIALLSELSENAESDLNKIVVKKVNDRIIRLADCVKIRRLESKPSGYYRINGQNTINIAVVADDKANQLNLGKEVKTMLVELQKTFPEGYKLLNTYDATEYISSELKKIYFRTGLTLLILLIFVMVVYRQIKYLLLIAISLIVNIAIAVILYRLSSVEIQLYSLAGITISLTLIIDNIIVFSDQIIHRGNKNAFTAILAATLTTIGSLVIIFFLDERLRLNLLDFAKVIMINLSVSLVVALFLVPALIEKLNIRKAVAKKSSGARSTFFADKLTIRPKRILIFFNRTYSAIIRFMGRKRILFVIFLVLLFGLPVFMLPDKIEKKGFFPNVYNNTLDTEFYKEHLKNNVNIVLGGTWRLFVQKVYNGSYFNGSREETMLHVAATLPNGSTLDQMNFLIQRMETYIGEFSEVRQFETSISNANRASITIRFTKPNQKNSFPHQLKSKLISKSLEFGGGSWSVYGVGDGFNNDIKEQAGSYRVEMYGYNYDELYYWAEKFRETLLEYRRIKEVTIDSEFSWYKSDYQEFGLKLKDEQLAISNIQPFELFNSISPAFEKNRVVAEINTNSTRERIYLRSAQSASFNVWDMENLPVKFKDKIFKLSELASIYNYQTPQKIAKENQQYRLCIQYEYIGAYQQGRRVLEENIESFSKELPMGYSFKAAEIDHWNWGKKENKQYWLLGIVFIIIYFCSSVLFNSLKQSLYVVFIIPFSFIGIFLTFYWFKLNFDQGGFAAFILLSGITVNANIYIINEFNNLRKRTNLSPMHCYIKAWNAKIRPIFLTIISTILGFIPFIVGYRENFWFPMAAGVIGGLLFSLLVIFFVLPLFMGLGRVRKI